MADFGTPVAQNVNGPQQTIQTISGLYGIKQQQAALGTAQAQEAQQQQTTQQRQGQRSFWTNFDPTQYIGSDGTIDMNKVVENPALRAAAGDDFPAIMQSIASIKSTQLTNMQSLVNLDQSTREQLQQQLGPLWQNKDVQADNPAGRALVAQTLDQFGSLSPEAARVEQTYAPMVEHAPPGRLAEGIKTLQMQAMAAGNQANAAQPQYFNTGPTAVQTNPYASTSKQNIGMKIPPGFSTVTDAAGNTYAVNAQNPSQTMLVWKAGQGGVNPYLPKGSTGNNPPQSTTPTTPQASNPNKPLAMGQIQNEQNQASTDQKDWASSVTPVYEAAQTKNVLHTISDLANQTITGPGSKYLADAETVLSQYVPGMEGAADDATKRQLLGKYVEQLAMRVTQANGYATDDARSLVSHAIPDPENMTPQAIKQAARFIQAQTEVGQALSSAATNYQKTNGSSLGWQQVHAKFMQNIDPRMFDFIGLNRQQQEQMLQKDFGDNKAAEADFLRKASVIRQLGGFDYATQGKATGGKVTPGSYVVGEEGPETLHLAPGSKGFVTPNPATAMHNPAAAKNFSKAHRLYGGAVVNGGMNPAMGRPVNPAMGEMQPVMPAIPTIPTMAPRPMPLNSLMQPQGFGNRFGMVR
jgi:hypothetical protein